MKNHLASQSSPYLLQHAENPVDWYPWCEEAFEKAKKDNKPVFLSIGYSTCHWCHVMAHESFEEKEIADILNKYFISIKVDREERPDIDAVYMEVCQAFTGSGGWPMSIFLTPGQKPFFAGTYFPAKPRYGMADFRSLLLNIAAQWGQEKEKLIASAQQVTNALQQKSCTSDGSVNTGLAKQAAQLFAESFDVKHGGFGTAPKFPTPHNLYFLLLYAHLNKDHTALQQALVTLEAMRRGGIFDQVGYGFSRYATDDAYLVPHFEKMLYDNALLIIAYCAAYKACGKKEFLRTAEQTAEYVLREMANGDGAFYSAQDADSEGEEGKFYIWECGEIRRVLGPEKGDAFCSYFGMSEQGNFEGKNIPNLLNGNAIEDGFDAERKALYRFRQARSSLHLDDKILTSWNALMVTALVFLYRVAGQRKYLLEAERAQRFLNRCLMDGVQLYAVYRNGKRGAKGFLDDYAFDAAALISLYEVSGQAGYLTRAEALCKEACRQFEDKDGGFFLYGTQHSQLITQPKECYDGAMPSGNSVLAYCLVRLSQLTTDNRYQQEAKKQLAFLSAQAAHYPAGYSMFLTALLYDAYPPQKITVVLAKPDTAETVLPRLPLYADVQILDTPVDGYTLLNEQTTFYVCKDFHCLPPSNTIS